MCESPGDEGDRADEPRCEGEYGGNDGKESDTAETGAEASPRLQMLDRASEGGGDRLLLDNKEFRVGGLVDGRIGIDGVERLVEECFGRFDHHEGGDNAAECVLDLIKLMHVNNTAISKTYRS